MPQREEIATLEADEALGLKLMGEFDGLREAGRALIDDVRRRHPGEELRCPHMRALDAALAPEEGKD